MKKAKKGYKLVKSLYGKYEEIPEEWDLKKLEAVTEKIFVGIATSTTKHFVPQGIPLLRNQNIKEGFIDTKELLHISKEFATANKSKQLNEGDVICIRTGYPGQSAVVISEMNGWQTFTTLIIRPLKKTLDSQFLSVFLNSDLGKRQVLSAQIGTAQQNLNAGSLSKMCISIPDINEQRKIVSVFSNVDSLINQTEKEIELTQKLKKGLMQKLLTRGIGHEKFKKVESLYGKFEEIPKNWELTRSQDIFTITMGQSPPSENYNRECNGLPFYQGVTDFGDIYPQPTVWCTNPQRIAKKDEVLFSVRAPVGETNITRNACCLGRGVASLNPKNNDLFYVYYLVTYNKKRFSVFSQGITYDAINRNEIANTKLPFTTNKIEQQKIGLILSNIDSKILEHKTCKSNLKTLKKGLMQKLLTGQIRVKI